MEEKEVEGNEFPKVEDRLVSLKFIVKPEAAMSKMVEGTQALDVEYDMLPVVVKGNE